MWQNKLSMVRAISTIAYLAKLMAFTLFFYFINPSNKSLLTFLKCPRNSQDTPKCYLLSHCQFEHSVYLGTSSVAKRCLRTYQHLHCYYSATVVTLSVLELVQLADMFRFIVEFWVKYMIWFKLAHKTLTSSL